MNYTDDAPILRTHPPRPVPELGVPMDFPAAKDTIVSWWFVTHEEKSNRIFWLKIVFPDLMQHIYRELTKRLLLEVQAHNAAIQWV